ncbi:MAG: META domain-containing protein [Acidimicrobiia bacterium]|nr:META domain-containing protein [Acidimicrobiia bacterium]
MKHLALILVLALTALIAACGEEQPPGADPFGDTTWQLASGTVDGTALVLIDGHPITFRVANGQVGGTAACNSYGGEITIENGVIVMGPTHMTEMWCGDEGVMDLEAAFLAALARIDGAALEADDLVLTGAGVELRFTALPEEPDAALVDTVWTLDTIIDGDTAATPAAPATLVFAADGTVSGSTGCNSLFGDYSAAGGFGPLGMTKMACEEPIMAQELLVTEILGPDATLTIEGSRLTIADLEGRALVYRAG